MREAAGWVDFPLKGPAALGRTRDLTTIISLLCRAFKRGLEKIREINFAAASAEWILLDFAIYFL